MSVFAVVQQCHAISVFRNIHPLMCADFELSCVVGRIAVRVAERVSVLYVASNLMTVNVNGETYFEHDMRLIPIDGCLEVNSTGVGIKNHVLLQSGSASDGVLRAQCKLQRAIIQDFARS